MGADMKGFWRGCQNLPTDWSQEAMAKEADAMEDSNRSGNPSIHDVSDPDKRQSLHWLMALGLLSQTTLQAAQANPNKRGSRLGFEGISASTEDAVRVPPGHTFTVLAPWGDPVGLPQHMPAFKPDASNTAEEQAAQLGMHHDGLVFFPLGGSSTHGLIMTNHEYTDDGLLHTDGMQTWTAEKVRKSQNAHGFSVYEVRLTAQGWQMVRPSRFARRITPQTAFALTGPAAGHPMLQTAADPSGRRVLGTLGNCASSMTPWGTYLSGEENWSWYFAAGDAMSAHHKRWGLRAKSFYQWEKHDERFDAARHENEPNRFGWIVEVDPMDPHSTPIKRTALGRFKHENASVVINRDGRVVVYMGDDERGEHIYKFVSKRRYDPKNPGANRDLLDEGTLYVARFDAPNDQLTGHGEWLELTHGKNGLTAEAGFASQAEVLIHARLAATVVGATTMDRPEWVAAHPHRAEVYATLTNNTDRGVKPNQPLNGPNPRAKNVYGQIVRWRPAQADHAATAFTWDMFVMAGNPSLHMGAMAGTSNVNADNMFNSPDGLSFDASGRLWIQTDGDYSNAKDFAGMGNNQMLACDTRTGEVRRFLTGPTNCEITGVTFTPDGRHMFISVQHPGETPSDRSDPKQPQRFSNWPDFRPDGRPRSANVVISRLDGGVIGG